MSDLELTISGNPRACEMESDDGRISIGGSIEEVVANPMPLLNEIVTGGRGCCIVSYVSLGAKMTQMLKETGARCKVDLCGALRKRNAQPPSKGWQMPGDILPDPPAPTYLSWAHYMKRTERPERMKRCYAASKKANRKRLLSIAPAQRLTGQIVWGIIEAAKGRCAYCGSLAVEARPSKANGAPAAWAQVGRRIGSLEHSRARFLGGNNFIDNLAWCCLWCNTWPEERRPGATDHGGYHPNSAA